MRQVLFLQDKYCSGNPKLGLSNNAHNILDTFQQSVKDAQMYTLFFDEAYMYGRHINEILEAYCRKFDIDTVFVSLLGTSPSNPSLNILNNLKTLGIKIVFIWCDNNPTEIYLQDRTLEISDLNVVLDYPTSDLHNIRRISHEQSGKYLYLWTPESKFLYYPDEQDIDVSFIGSIRYPDRAEYVRKLQQVFPNIYIRGGQRENYLSPEGYASLIRRSKININFSKNMDGYSQCKGRVFEALASKTLLLEEDNYSTPAFFDPMREYRQFTDIESLIKQIEFYTKNPDMAEMIAQNGYNKYKNNWTSQHFWDRIKDKLWT
jgi:spore maturation protein CgeB